MDVFKKHLFYKRPFDLNHFKSELADSLWNLTMAADIVGCSLEDLMRINTEKLRKRYPNGFTIEDANNRKENDL